MDEDVGNTGKVERGVVRCCYTYMSLGYMHIYWMQLMRLAFVLLHIPSIVIQVSYAHCLHTYNTSCLVQPRMMPRS